MATLLGLSLVTAIAGCERSSTSTTIDPATASSKAMAERNETLKKMAHLLLDQAIRDRLKDPDSMQTRNVVYYTHAGELDGKLWPMTHVLCGELNAKNSLGGFVGYRRFVASMHINASDGEPRMDTVGVFIDDPNDSIERQAYEKWAQRECQNTVRKIE